MNPEPANNEESLIGPSYDEIKKRWNLMSPLYVTFDSAPQTFFYTLSNMLKLNQAKNVLQIACGAGKLIPQVLDLKAPETFYFATDISEEMINFAKLRLQKHFQKYQSNLTFEEWMKKQNLEFALMNGEQRIPKEIKFDRIICNLVLMLTTDPKKMLLNLWQSAAQDCLLGLTVWGSKANSNVFELVQNLSQQHGLTPPKARSNFFLSERIQTLVEECGWETILKWQQGTLFPITEHSQGNVHPFIGKQILSRFPVELHNKVLEKVDQWINKQKCGLTFGGKLMIVKKKSNI